MFFNNKINKKGKENDTLFLFYFKKTSLNTSFR